MINKLKNIIIGLFLGLFLLISALLAYFYFNQHKIVDLLISEINNRVNTKIDVGSVSMSFWERFPSVSIKFQNVIVYNPEGFSINQQNSLLSAESIFFDLDISTLISDDPQISRLAVDSGKIFLGIDTHGNTNYDVFSLNQNQKESQQTFKIEAFDLKRVSFLFKDLQQNIHYNANISHANIEGTFQQTRMELSCDIQIQENNLIPPEYQLFQSYSYQGNVQFFNNSHFEWEGTFNAGSLSVPNSGFYYFKKKQLGFDAKTFQINKRLINKILKNNELDRYTITDGALNIQNMHYRLKNTAQQRLTCSFSSNTAVKLGKNEIETLANGTINSKGKTLKISFKTFDANFRNSTFHFNGDINLPSLNIEGLVSFNFDLEHWNTELKKSPVKNLSGIIDGQAQVHFKIKEQPDYSNIFSNGELGLTDVQFNIAQNNFQVSHLNGIMNFSPKKVHINSLKGNFNQNPLKFTGTIEEPGKYIFENKPLTIKGKATSKQFALSKFLHISGNQNDQQPLKLSDDIRLDLTFECNQLIQNHFRANDFMTKLKKFGRRIEIHQIKMNTANGTISGKGKLLQQKNDEWYVRLQSDLKNVDVAQMFRQMGNFGQKYIQSKNLAGKLTASVESDFVFYPDFRIHPESIYLSTDLTIKNGALINYKTLKALSDYISVEELQHVKFEQLKNHITIKNQTITIPFMDIKSSAINIGLRGTHTFSNHIDYQVSVGLSDILFRKFQRKHQNTKSHQRNNKTMVYVDITGTTDDYDFSFSKIRREPVTPSKKPTEKEKMKFDIDFEDFK